MTIIPLTLASAALTLIVAPAPSFERTLNMWTMGRLALYILGLGAGGLALTGYATFDPETWVLDIHPFDLQEFTLTAVTTGGNAVAAIAVWRGWRGRGRSNGTD